MVEEGWDALRKKFPQPFFRGDVIPRYMNVEYLFNTNDNFYIIV